MFIAEAPRPGAPITTPRSRGRAIALGTGGQIIDNVP
jgi:hypothetical protein